MQRVDIATWNTSTIIIVDTDFFNSASDKSSLWLSDLQLDDSLIIETSTFEQGLITIYLSYAIVDASSPDYSSTFQLYVRDSIFRNNADGTPWTIYDTNDGQSTAELSSTDVIRPKVRFIETQFSEHDTGTLLVLELIPADVYDLARIRIENSTFINSSFVNGFDVSVGHPTASLRCVECVFEWDFSAL